MSKKLTIASKDIGKVVVTSVKEPNTQQEYLLKGTSILQIMILNEPGTREEKEKYEKFIEVMKSAIRDCKNIYNQQRIDNENGPDLY